MSSQRAKVRICSSLRFSRLVLLFFLAVSAVASRAQDISSSTAENAAPGFRVEKFQLANGAEILTVFAKARAATGAGAENEDVPMLSVLRDTLGDERPENDRLRYLWMLTYAKPTFWQRAAGYVPFLYGHTSNRTTAGKSPPPPIADIRRSDKPMWNRLFWTFFRQVVLDEVGIGIRASALQARRNARDHKRSAITGALTLLALYEAAEGEKLLTDAELKDIQARLWLSDKALGWHMRDENLSRVYLKETSKAKETLGSNWELLRQYSEAQGLYFDPIVMPDGDARHVMLWVAEDDLEKNKGRKFDSRFLNIKNPWSSGKLANWKGYAQTRWFDAENRVVDSSVPNAVPRKMIPLALYGLDHPKIPAILIDFQDQGNPKRREMSRRVLNDVTGNLLSVSKFSSIPYFFGRFVYEFATERRGADLNQASRLRSYSQLKMLLALDTLLDDGLRDEIADRIERVSMNPHESDFASQINLAKQQYRNLMDFAASPDGLPKMIDRDRREEMVGIVHDGTERFLLKTANILTLGLYKHRERPTLELQAKLDIRRQLGYHERVLAEVAMRSANPDIDSDAESLRRSLKFIAEHGDAAKVRTAKTLAKIFRITPEIDLQAVCLAGLYRINNSAAKKELLQIYEDKVISEKWRTVTADYLRKALDEGQRISKADAAAITGISAVN